MMRLPRSRRRHALLVVGIAMVAGVVLGSLLTSRTSADEGAILSLVSRFEAAEAAQASIPSDAVPIVEARLKELADAESRSVADDEQSSRDILPAAVCDEMNKALAERLATYCSEAYQKRHTGDVPLSNVVEAGLYNSPAAPLCLESKQKLLAGVVKKNEGDVAFVWTYSWSGDLTTSGEGGQSWTAEEYRLVKEDGAWRIDGRSCLATASSKASADNGSTSWGPYSPHYSLAEAQVEGASELGLDSNAIREGLKNLEDLALADAGQDAVQ